jgi:hypothetical protein
MRILVFGENRHISTGDARRWVKYKGFKWTGTRGRSPIERDPDWRPPSNLRILCADFVQGYYVGDYEYPEMTLIPETPANRYPREMAPQQRGRHGYSWEARRARQAGR